MIDFLNNIVCWVIAFFMVFPIVGKIILGTFFILVLQNILKSLVNDVLDEREKKTEPPAPPVAPPSTNQPRQRHWTEDYNERERRWAEQQERNYENMP